MVEGWSVVELWMVVIAAAPVGYVGLLILARWLDRKVRSK